MLLGFSNNAFHKFMESTSKKAIDLGKKLNCNAIELNCPDTKKTASRLKNIKKEWLDDFKYKSIHGPGIIYKNNKRTKEILDIVEETCNRLKLNCVVIHPDTIEDWRVFKKYSFTIGIENMDKRKSLGQTPQEFKKILKRKYKLVLDMNHCYTVDKTMKIVEKFYQKFKKRIAHYHISGYIKLHEPLFISHRNEILNAIPNKNIPIIIESEFDNIEQVEKEYNYIIKHLK